MAIALGYIATLMVEAMSPKVFKRILAQITLGRLIYSEQVVPFVAEAYRNVALDGKIFFISGGLRL